MLKILVTASLMFISCITATPHLHSTDQYTITKRTGHITEFKEIPGRYIIECKPVDTLKAGDKIMINVIRYIKHHNKKQSHEQ